MSLQQVDHHLSSNQRLLDKIQSTQDTILEFDILTGDTKTWAWYVLSRNRWTLCSMNLLNFDRPKPEGEERIPVFRLAEYRATHLLKFPCCLCARLLDIVTESAVYIAATGEYRGFWVASCAKDMCGYFGEYAHECLARFRSNISNSAAPKVWASRRPLGKGLSKPK